MFIIKKLAMKMAYWLAFPVHIRTFSSQTLLLTASVFGEQVIVYLVRKNPSQAEAAEYLHLRISTGSSL